MLLNRENQSASNINFLYDTIYFQAPGGDDADFEEGDWDDEDDEDFDDQAEDLDDLHEIQVDDDLGEPDPDDDDHFPDGDL